MSLKKLIHTLNPITEPNFTYYEVGSKYEVTINTLEAGVNVPKHTHDQDVF